LFSKDVQSVKDVHENDAKPQFDYFRLHLIKRFSIETVFALKDVLGRMSTFEKNN